MLRAIFGLPSRVDEGLILQVNQCIQAYCQLLKTKPRSNPESIAKFATWEISASGFMVSLNELEQSKFASGWYREKVRESFVEDSHLLEMDHSEMDKEELEHYRLHMYYYKNAFIRIFSILDKLGYFLNDLFDLQTQREKVNFSYFTVLRQMHKFKLHPNLEQKLFVLKEQYEEPLHKLRNMRNIEIHSGSIEIQDDLLQIKHPYTGQVHNDHLQVRMKQLDDSYTMVCLTFITVFQYCLNNKTARENH